MSFFRHHVQQHGCVHGLDHLQVFFQQGDVVAVDRADVTESQILEDHPAMQTCLDALFQLREETFGWIPQHRHLVQCLDDFRFKTGVERIRPQLVQIFAHPADARADRHLVVIQNHQQLVLQMTDVVHRLPDDPRWEGSVTDDSYGMAIGFARQFVTTSQPHDRRDACSGMARHKQIVFALVRVRVTHQPVTRSHRAELAITARHQLVRVDLMPGIPDQTILAKIVNRMERQTELDDAQVGGVVGSSSGHEVGENITDFIRQLVEFLNRPITKVIRRFDAT